jgi:hypothetical protein
MSGLVVVFLALGCIGFGMTALRLTGTAAALTRVEQLTWGFGLGMGVLGWLLFFTGIAGWLSPIQLAAVPAAGVAGLLAFRGAAAAPPRPDTTPFGLWGRLLLGLLAVVLSASLIQGLAPPADGDSMAYHFALPKQFLIEGAVQFVPRAMDGAIPLLPHMTYMAALGLGGETALTLWTMTTGWMAAALLFSLCRRHLDRRWALAATLVFLTTPAVVFGAASGQVEVRNAIFAMLGAAAVAEALRSGQVRWAVVAGLGAGFFMGGKLLGLQFALACGLTLMAQRRWFIHGLVFSVAALAAGGQWYAWNWLNSGDPFFPVLYGIVPYRDPTFWNARHHDDLADMLREVERAVPISLTWLLSYPFVATLAGKPIFESGRTGFGPFALLALPFVLGALWRFRHRLRTSPLAPVAAVALLAYVIWFVMGSSQRLRHILPAYPLLLLCVAVAAERWAAASGTLRPLAGVVAVTLLVQLGGVAVFTAGFARSLLSGETRDQFLLRNVSVYGAVPWINGHLTRADRIFVPQRWLVYTLNVPSYYGHFIQDARVDVTPEADDPLVYYRDLRRVGATHLLALDGDEPERSGIHQWRGLRELGCLETLKTFDVKVFGSRTLGLGANSARAVVFRLRGPECLPPGR